MSKPRISLVLLLSFALSACSLSETGLAMTADMETAANQIGQSELQTNAPQTQTLTIFAAASLTDAFSEIGEDFETAHPGVKVIFSFAGSQVLRTQLEQGAVADIFASADHKNMDYLNIDNLVVASSIQDFVTNRLVVILPPGNQTKVETLQDLARPGIKLVLADSSVPVGNYARQVLSNMSKDSDYGADYSSMVMDNVLSNETDVRQVVTKVELGEADAGIVYFSDAFAAQNLSNISIPDQFNVIAKYPIAVLDNSPNPNLAAAFVAYVTSPAGQAIMDKWGFSPEN